MHLSVEVKSFHLHHNWNNVTHLNVYCKIQIIHIEWHYFSNATVENMYDVCTFYIMSFVSLRSNNFYWKICIDVHTIIHIVVFYMVRQIRAGSDHIYHPFNFTKTNIFNKSEKHTQRPILRSYRFNALILL